MLQLELFSRDQDLRLLIEWAIERSLISNPRPRRGVRVFPKRLVREVLTHYKELLECGLSEERARGGAITHYPDAASIESAVVAQGGADWGDEHEAALMLCHEALDWVKQVRRIEFDPEQFERTRSDPRASKPDVS